MPEQEKELADLRRKYLSKLLLSGVNKVRNTIESEVHKFASKSDSEKEELAKNAFAIISSRLDAKR
ncbi:hypothetical protein HanHA300_Chr04g0150481 [Helianthus annuus]|nr:hypothetical protein HanHA300_Chr04g0150481 [Helianthus annuus]KAJ0598259.1 hypothetical protein HanHA89_Chr04g0163811 [Helianthus annuus]KAJ0758887.1 hypothetical protein HanLR1_Chr04g0155351 [Helianthus annuus]KAJ0762536.1 hypothetical protein HanOQP8_Chr04g0162441 [Helianthus annuus]KAJ0932759.1 hypothetical protein HanPSC8_Chr04g0177311 [Helianthus annuus]